MSVDIKKQAKSDSILIFKYPSKNSSNTLYNQVHSKGGALCENASPGLNALFEPVRLVGKRRVKSLSKRGALKSELFYSGLQVLYSPDVFVRVL